MNKQKNDTISVIITTYKRLKSCKRAIHSVLSQTHMPNEIIVVEDNSDSGIKSWLDEKHFPNIRYIRNSHNKGLSASRNLGWKQAKTKFIAYLDDDDEWKPDSIQKRMTLISKLSTEELKNIGVVYCGCEIHILNEKRISFNMPKIEGEIKKNIIVRDLSTIPSSCIFPKDTLKIIGGFDEQIISSIDHDIWMTLATNGFSALAVNEALTITYQNSINKSMMVDTTPRIKGVEQYIAKWEPTFIKWFAKKNAMKYIKRYRIKVLGILAGKKIAEKEFNETKRLILHILRKNGYSMIYTLLLAIQVFRTAISIIFPIKIKLMLISKLK
jgi:glycosyltransferase involved in cell wall biosynthesis